jgi:SAM-dependent methyltransferase
MTDERTESRQRWSGSATGWERYADRMRDASMPVSRWLVEAINPQPGHELLELAAGPGDTGFLAAELIQPGGTLISSDFVPEMLSAAQRRAAALGLDNVRFKQIDAELPFDLGAASLDGVLCRWGYMLLRDPEAALRETRRVLRPGARVALAAWTGPEDNPWSAVPAELLTERGLAPPPEPGPGQFTWAREGAIAEHLDAAGFVEHAVERVDFSYRFGSVEDWWAIQSGLSMRVRDAAAAMDAATRDAVVEELRGRVAGWTGDDGALEFPARTWVAWAEA